VFLMIGSGDKVNEYVAQFTRIVNHSLSQDELQYHHFETQRQI
jgi:hypothetical protein